MSFLDLDTRPELAWQADAACAEVGGDIWFPEKGQEQIVSAAKTICGHCPVRRECLEYALANDERFGVWGGTSEGDRREIRQQRRREEVAS